MKPWPEDGDERGAKAVRAKKNWHCREEERDDGVREKMENGNAVVPNACRTREETRIRGTKSWNKGGREYGVGGFQSNPLSVTRKVPSVMSGTDWRQVERDQNVSNTSDP